MKEESRASRARRLYLERKNGPTLYLDDAPQLETDTLWRGLARNGEVRILVVRATAAVREAAKRLECSDDAARLLGELVVATLLVRSTLNPEERMQVFLRHHGPVGQIIVDIWESGGFRVHVRHPEATRDEFGFLVGQGILEVFRSRSSAQSPYRSAVSLEGENVDDFMMKYLLESEQILSLLRVEVEVRDGVVQQAVGYLVQLMPEGTRDDLHKLVQNIETLPPLGHGMTRDDADGRAWAEALLRGLRWDQCAREAVRYQCRCSEDRILHMLSTLPRAEIAELASGHELLEMVCDYCKTRYHLRPAQVAMLLEKPS